MQYHNILITLIIICISTTACQFAISPLLASAQKPKSLTSASSPKPAKSGSRIIDKEYFAYSQQIREKFSKNDLKSIDQEATRVRVSKARLPGGYWKLRALYAALEAPSAEAPSDGDWEDHINKLEGWTKQEPQSITSRVALGAAWTAYAWKARGSGYAATVSDTAWKVFGKRLATAAQVLKEAVSVPERCPHWYVRALWVGIGQSWDRADLERVFQAGIELEPTYYYLHQAKATYLLPRWGGEEGEWERFAEESALNAGGHQGDIIFFAIYSEMFELHGLTFMNTHHDAWPRVLGGFRSIEKLYGASLHRLNEACYFAISCGDKETATELFNRIGEEYDETVWRSKTNFDGFRSTLALAKRQIPKS